jgi:hypothetical protein
MKVEMEIETEKIKKKMKRMKTKKKKTKMKRVKNVIIVVKMEEGSWVVVVKVVVWLTAIERLSCSTATAIVRLSRAIERPPSLTSCAFFLFSSFSFSPLASLPHHDGSSVLRFLYRFASAPPLPCARFFDSPVTTTLAVECDRATTGPAANELAGGARVA